MLNSKASVQPMPLALLHLIAMPSPHCTDTYLLIASVQPMLLTIVAILQCTDQFIFKGVGLTGRPFPTASFPNHRCGQLTPQMYSIFHFHFSLDTLTVIWTL
jgi:hypothetical protein